MASPVNPKPAAQSSWVEKLEKARRRVQIVAHFGVEDVFFFEALKAS